MQVAGEPAKWHGLYALGFALILLLWLAKMSYNLVVLRGKPQGKLGKDLESNGSSSAASNSSGSGELKKNARRYS